jgi:hypothetical protein
VFLVATFATMESTSIMVSIISFAPAIPNLVLDVVLAREGGTKGGRTKLGKAWA